MAASTAASMRLPSWWRTTTSTWIDQTRSPLMTQSASVSSACESRTARSTTRHSSAAAGDCCALLLPPMSTRPSSARTTL